MNQLNKVNVKVAIIGGGPGGLFAASTLSFFKYDNCIIEQNEYLGGQLTQLYPNKPVYDFPTQYGITANGIIDKLIEQINQYDTTQIFLSNTVVDIVKVDEKYVITTNKNIIECEYIILATGIGAFTPNKLVVKEQTFEADNIHYTVSTNNKIYQNKKVVVLGGGDSAIDWANYFANNNITNKVAIVHRRDEYRAQNKGIDMLKRNNIQEFLNYEIIEVNNTNLVIQHNDTKKQYKIHYDYLIVQYGQTPSPFKIDLLNDLKRNEVNKIVTDQNQKTNIKNIFAIGAAAGYNAKANTIVTACAEATAVVWYLAKNKLEW